MIVIVIVIVWLNVSGRTLFRHYEVYLVPYTLIVIVIVWGLKFMGGYPI